MRHDIMIMWGAWNTCKPENDTCVGLATGGSDIYAQVAMVTDMQKCNLWFMQWIFCSFYYGLAYFKVNFICFVKLKFVSPFKTVEVFHASQIGNNWILYNFYIPGHTCNWATSRQNQQNDCAPSKDSDNPGHPHSQIRVFAVRSMGS